MANIGVVRSITQVGTYEPFELQVARGQITGHSTVNIYGAQSNVANTYIAVWENASAYTYPASAAAMKLASSVNTGDDLSGTTISISGLDANYAAISETLALTGTTAVDTTKEYLRINSMAVTAGAPTGVITLKNAAGSATYAQINATVGRTQMSIYTVPAGYTLYLSRIDAYTSMNGSNSDYSVYRNYSTSSSNVSSLSQQAPFTNTYHAQRVMPRPFLEKTDIQLQARTNANTAFISIAGEGILVKNAITGSIG